MCSTIAIVVLLIRWPPLGSRWITKPLVYAMVALSNVASLPSSSSFGENTAWLFMPGITWCVAL